VPLNTSQVYTATGTFSDGSTRDLSGVVVWDSSAPAIARIDSKGVVTGLASGTSTVSASLGTTAGSTTLVVTAPTINSIVVTPNGPTPGIGIAQTFTATAIYSDGSAQDLAAGVTWSSSASNVATIDNSGVADTLAAGTTTITATVGAFSGTATLTVVPTRLVSISVTPSPVSLARGTAQQFTATGTFDDGSTQVLTSATWGSSDNHTLAVDPATGVATAVGTGAATVSATSGSVTGSAPVTVTPATLVSIAVTPASLTLPTGTFRHMKAVGTFSDSSTQDVTLSAVWSSSNHLAATVDARGVVTAIASGTATISALVGAVSGSASLTVSPVTLTAITVSPSNPKIQRNTAIQLTAVGTFSDGSTATNLAGLAWTSSNARVAPVHGGGWVFGKKNGTTTITASVATVKGTTTVAVYGAALVSMTITPANAIVPVGATQQFTATALFTDGSQQDITNQVHWGSSHASVANISNGGDASGLATTTAAGTTVIGASYGTKTATTLLTVQ
jgi:uncharacterized protein YjdB